MLKAVWLFLKALGEERLAKELARVLSRMTDTSFAALTRRLVTAGAAGTANRRVDVAKEIAAVFFSIKP